MRRNASQPPRMTPKRSMAVREYREQLGTNRQWFPSQGLMTRRYALMSISASLRMGSDFTPVNIKRSENFPVAATADAGANQHYKVKLAHTGPVETETFPDQAFYSIALDGITGIFDGNDCAEPWVTQIVMFHKHGEVSIADLDVAMPEDSLETGGSQQAVRSGVGGAGARQGDRSDRKTRATFSPACLDDKTTVLGAHTGTETVSTLALQVARLECSFHGANRFQKRLKARIQRAKSGRADYWLYPAVVNLYRIFYLPEGCG